MKNNEILSINEIERIGKLLLKIHGEQMKDFWLSIVFSSLRINELLPIKFTDINEGVLKINNSKCSQNSYESRSLRLPKQLLNLISSIEKENPSNIYVFQSKNSHNMKNREAKPISRQFIYSAFKEVSDIVKKQITPNTTRKISINSMRQASVNDFMARSLVVK